MIGKKIIANFPSYNTVIRVAVPDLTYVSKNVSVNCILQLDCNIVNSKIAYFRKLSDVDNLTFAEIDNWTLKTFDMIEK